MVSELGKGLTPPESAPIIATLCVLEAWEKRLARRVAALQAAVLLVVAGVAFGLGGAPHDVMALLGGGSASVLNGALLAWRMSGTAPAPARKSDGFHNAQRELRRMYFFAAERFVAIIACLGVCLAVLKLPPLAVLVGFVAGQVVLLAARLFLNRLFKSNKDKNQ